MKGEAKPVNRSSKGEQLGTLYRCSVSSMSPGGDQALPEGHQVLQRQVSYRETQLRSRTTRERQEDQGCRLRSAVAGKTESQTHLLHPGRTVPELLRERGQIQGCYWREAARVARAAFGQRRLPVRFRSFPPSGATVGASRTRAGEW